jgi:HEAT repeat protein
MIAPSEFQCYLQKICRHYEQWWAVDALTETIADQQATFSFEQMVQTEEKKPREKPQIVSLPILKGIQNYIESEHILLVGSPGVGKSTALLHCLVSFAKEELGKAEPRIPVLVPLKRYNVRFSSSEDPSGMLTLIRDALKPQLRLKIPEVEELLFQKRLILLLDGLNEMPADTVRTQLKAFREECDEIPLICTTRELGSGDLGIKRRLEVQPPSPLEINRFLRECMPAQAQQVLQLLSRDNRELSRTPFVLWMLYQLFQETGAVVETLGEAFRQFFRSFKKYKEDAPVTDERRKAWNPWLEHLAFTMLNSSEPTDPGLVISDNQAEKVLAQKFGDLHGGSSRIEQLLKYHLLERASDREVNFHHQLIQEYYAAEYLLQYLPELLRDEEGETKLKCYYLNHLKWTEPIAIMLGLPEITENQAEKLIELAIEVDLKLGARLAGEVKPEEFQQKTVNMIAGQEVPEWFKIFLLGETKSPKAADELMKTLEHPEAAIRSKSVWASRKLGSEAAMPLIFRAIKDSDSYVRETAIRAIGELRSEQTIPLVTQILTKEPIASVREAAVMSVLGKLDSEAAILELLRATQDTEHNAREMAIHYLEEMNHEIVISVLTKALKNIDTSIRKGAAKLLGKLGNEKIIIDLFEAQLDLKPDVHYEAFDALDKVRNRAIAKESDVTKHQEVQRKQQIDMWLGYLNSEESIQRGNAILYLTSLLGKETAIPLATQALDDPHHYVRGHAITSLARLIGKEAVPLAVRTLNDPHYQVRDQAAQTLIGLGQNLPENLEIAEETVSKLIQIINEAQDISVRSVTIRTLTNLCSIQPSLLLREDLELAFLNASDASDKPLRSDAARGIGKFSSERASSRLLQMLRDSDSLVVLSATEALKNMPSLITAKHLPALIELNLNSTETWALDAIFTIQERCGFYNYDIAQLPPPHGKGGKWRAEDFLHDKLEMITQELKKVSEEPKRIIHTQSYFEKGTHSHTHNYANDETLKQDIPEVRQLVHQLQQTNQPTTEVQAAEIIDIEFREIQKTNPTRWQTIRKQLQLLKCQLLNPESHLKATKATLAEVAKHYLEESVVSKALITYLDTMSAETDQGE